MIATYPILRPMLHGSYDFSTHTYGPSPANAPHATRAYYYTSMPHENAKIVTNARLRIREAGFEPRVFPRRSGKSKAVDLALATDVLTLAGEHQYDVAVIFAGDGDYVPVVEAVKRLGRHAVIGFFEGEGMSDDLKIAADDFVDLEPLMVARWRGFLTSEEKEAKAAREKALREERQAKEAKAKAERQTTLVVQRTKG
ncbi:MAG: NYN domain-containing protein [bacterium]